MMSELGIIIVSWNVSALLERCLDSVFASVGIDPFHVIIVDNASSDDSVAMVRERFTKVELIENEANLGYPAANNQGLRALNFHSEGRPEVPIVLLLNPDTELPPTALQEMLAFFRTRPSLGAAGPKIVLPDGSLDLACRRSFPSPGVAFWHFTGLARMFPKVQRFGRYNMTYIDPDQEIAVDSVVGAFMMVRSEAVDEVGLLDERFFMYGEDLDWAYRIRQAGWEIRYNPAVVIRHVKRASSQQSSRAKKEFYRSMLLFYQKHYQEKTTIWLHYLVLLGILIKGGRGIWPITEPKITSTIRQ